jgi:hypothetical protein
MDGILGLGTSSSAPTSSLLSALASAKLITSRLYALHLPRGTETDGELNFGAVNNARFSGALEWIPCVSNDLGFWQIPASYPGISGQRTAIIDSGTSFILMPPADAEALHSSIPGVQRDGETFQVPCDTKAELTFTFGTRNFSVATRDWRGGKLDTGLCRSNVIGRQTFGEQEWLVGDVFLKNVYAVFDAEGGGRVGFGTLKEGESASSSTVGSAGASTSKVPAATGTEMARPEVTSGGSAVQTTVAVQGDAGGQGEKSGGVKVGVEGLVGGVVALVYILG